MATDISSQNLSQDLVDNTELKKYIKSATSNNTRKAYQSAIRQFYSWGGQLPANTEIIIKYLLYQSERINPRSLSLHITAIGQWHELQCIDNPTKNPLIKKTLKGIQRIHGSPPQQAKSIDLQSITKILSYLRNQDDSLKKKRDIAILLTGFLGALRRSELVNIKISDLQWEKEGLIIKIPVSKTDQEHRGILRGLPFGNPEVCAATSVKDWITVSNISSGFLFRGINQWNQLSSSHLNACSINLLLKKWCELCGIEEYKKISSHSLRRSMSTSASKEKGDFSLIKKQGGWKTDSIVRRYIEEGSIITDNICFVLMQKMEKLMK